PIYQSTLITTGSITCTTRDSGFVTDPGGGLTESQGRSTMRQMSMIIFSRETALKLVFGSFPNKLFIIEFDEGRYCPLSTYLLPTKVLWRPVAPTWSKPNRRSHLPFVVSQFPVELTSL